MLQRWLRICWKWSTFWKTCTNHNAWECWTRTGCNPQKLAMDSVRAGNWSGDSENYCVWDFDSRSLHEICRDKIRSTLLLSEQKGHHAAVANVDSNCYQWTSFLKVITRDESWVYGYDLKTMALSSQWKSPGSPRPKKSQQSRSNIKTMLTVFFDGEVLSIMSMLL